MKYIVFLCFFITSCNAMEIDETKNYFKMLPDEILLKIHRKVIKSIVPALSRKEIEQKRTSARGIPGGREIYDTTAMEAALETKIQELKQQNNALALVDKRFYTIIHDTSVIKSLINHVAQHYFNYMQSKRVRAALALKMPKVTEWLAQHIFQDEIESIVNVIKEEILSDKLCDTYYFLSNAHFSQKLPLSEIFEFTSCYEKRESVIDMLIAAGCTMDYEDDKGNTPLHAALTTFEGFNHYLPYLLQAKVSLNKKNKEGATPLISGVRVASTDRIEENILLLLEQPGIHIDEQDNNGRTALMSASLWGRKNIVEKLLERGARIDLKDNNDLTTLNYAYGTSFRNVDVMILLESAAKK